jgi:hypothetical protein
VGVEEVGETGGWDRGYRTGLVVEGGDEDDGFQCQVVGFCSGDGGMSVLEVGGESLDGGAGAWGLEVVSTMWQQQGVTISTYVGDVDG